MVHRLQHLDELEEKVIIYNTYNMHIIRNRIKENGKLPAGDTCLKEVAAGSPSAVFSSFTSCHPFSASHRLMKPGDPLRTVDRI